MHNGNGGRRKKIYNPGTSLPSQPPSARIEIYF